MNLVEVTALKAKGWILIIYEVLFFIVYSFSSFLQIPVCDKEIENLQPSESQGKSGINNIKIESSKPAAFFFLVRELFLWG